MRAHEGQEVDLVAQGQVGDQVIVSQGCALMGRVGELRGKKQDPHHSVTLSLIAEGL
jgi:hypothetical protein